MATLASPLKVRNFTVKNRVVLPPLVIFSLHRDGNTNDTVANHYESFARGGCGTIIVEATCVSPEGKLGAAQLGLWQDAQIDGMKRIAKRVLPHGAQLLLQIHYASTQGIPDNISWIGPSEYTDANGPHRALATAEVERIRDGFVAAAVRAEKAGFHGVELHGAHGFLLCAFMNPRCNTRSDRYADPTLLPREIIRGIRQSTGSDFIISCRVGANNPDIATGVANCKALEAEGLDLLNVSFGMNEENVPPMPSDLPFSRLAWLACEVKKHVKLPVIAVGGLNDPAIARKLVEESRADFAAVGRGQLADPEWAGKALAGLPVNRCMDCKTGCLWGEDSQKCPARKKLLKSGG